MRCDIHTFIIHNTIHSLMQATCRDKLINKLKDIRSSQANKNCSEAILILDPKTTKIFNSLLTLEILFQCGINELTRVDLLKKPSPATASIYYISTQSLLFLFRDFRKEPIYYSANVLICDPIENETMKTVAKETLLLERLSSFGQLILNTRYLNDNIGLIGSQSLFFDVLLDPRKTAERIVPFVKEAIFCAFSQQVEMEVYAQESKASSLIGSELKKQGGAKGKDRLKVMVFDRSHDLASPLVRGFQYLALLTDLCSLSLVPLRVKEEEKGRGKEETKGDGKNDEGCVMKWDNQHLTVYRSIHIAVVNDRIRNDMNAFTQTNSAARMQKNAEGVELRDVVRGLGDYNQLTKSFSQHLGLIDTLSKLSTAFSLPEVGDLEHSLISGINSRGEPKKDSSLAAKVIEQADSICRQTHVSQQTNAVRLLMLALLTLNISDKQPITQRLKALGYPALSALGRRKAEKCAFEAKAKTQLYLNRHLCRIAADFERAVKGTTMKTKESILQEKYRKFNMKKEENKWVICVIGGMGLNEFTQLETIAKENECSLNIITDWLFTPNTYLQMLNEYCKKIS